MRKAVKKTAMTWCLIASVTTGAISMYDTTKYSKANEPGTKAEDVGKNYSTENDGDYVSVGVRLRVNGKEITYAIDNWQSYVCWVSGDEYLDGVKDKKENEYLTVASSNSSTGRFIFHANKIKPLLQTGKYAIYRTVYQYGKICAQDVEYSWKKSSLSDDQSMLYALNNGRDLPLGSRTGSSKSYIYDIYDVTELGGDNTIPIHVEYADLVENGIATYNGFSYNIKSFPKLNYNREGYSASKQEWFLSPDSTKPLKEGDEINPGGELYVRWTDGKSKYNVRCIDVFGEDATGTQLGKKDWQAEYGAVVRGSDLGDDTANDAYYPGKRYTGCSEENVTTRGCTIYRYFAPDHYTVAERDIVTEGHNKGQVLGNQEWYAEENVKVSGESLGSDPGEGAYYEGYRYVGATEGIVTKNGCEVTRNFVPITYDVIFDGNGATEGTMSSMEHCNYGEENSLPSNTYTKLSNITFNLNRGNDSSDDILKMPIKSEFQGWSETPGGKVVYKNGEKVKNLCKTTGTKKLYASWYSEDDLLSVSATKKGYVLDGWSENPDAEKKDANLQLKDGMTLYAVWKPISGQVEFNKNLPEGEKETEETALTKLEYQYDQSNKLSEKVYHVPGYKMIGWSKTQNGAVDFRPGDNLNNAFLEDGNHTLYAVWEADNHVAFCVTPMYEKRGHDGYEQGSDMILYGTTGEQIGNALKEAMKTDTFRGFSLQETDDLQVKIAGDGSTKVTVYCNRKSYSLKYDCSNASNNGSSAGTVEEIHVYGDSFSLKTDLNGISDIAGYRDQEGNFYKAGDAYVVTKDCVLVPQHSIEINTNNGNSSKREMVDHGKMYVLPSAENGNLGFDGWYYDSGYTMYAGNKGEVISHISKNISLYAKWKAPERYNIVYNTSACKNAIILAGKITSYQTGDNVVLPDASQVVVDPGTHFVGWYIQGDPQEKTITSLPRTQTGMVVLCLKVEPDADAGKGEENKGTQSGTTGGNAGTGAAGNAGTGAAGNAGTTGGNAGTGAAGNAGATGGNAGTGASGNAGATEENAGTGTQSGTSSTQNPDDKDDIVTPSQGNSEISVSKKEDDTVKKEKNKVKYKKVGTTFFKNNLKYKVTSTKKAKYQVKVMGLQKVKKELVIPKNCKVEGVSYDVTEIDAKAFQNKGITKVTIGSSVKKIGTKAFYRCKNLKICKLGSKVSKVGSKAFFGLKKGCKIYGQKSQEKIIKKSGISKTTKFVRNKKETKKK